MNDPNSQGIRIQHNVSLKPYNTFGFDVSAQTLAIVTDARALPDFFKTQGAPQLILGGGSNVVIKSPLKGAVLLNRISGIDVKELGNHRVQIVAGSGENWDKLVRFSLDQGLWGIENLGLIPGTVGAAPMQNIGAYGVELDSVLSWVEAINISTGNIQRFTRAECGLEYRHSVFKSEYKDQFFITKVALELSRAGTPLLSYEPLKQRADSLIDKISHPRQVYELVCDIRSSKLPDPVVLGNAGSFFKNPVIDSSLFLKLQTQFPQVPHYPAQPSQIKIAAGWLIEKAGWKGKRIGPVGVHQNQALVLVNYGGGTPDDLLDLAEKIQNDVFALFGIRLEMEPTVITN